MKRTLVSQLRLARHKQSMSDPVYKEGYLAKNHFKKPYPVNPYPYPIDIDSKRMQVAYKEHIMPEDREKLSVLNKLYAQSEYDRWVKGNYYRWCRWRR